MAHGAHFHEIAGFNDPVIGFDIGLGEEMLARSAASRNRFAMEPGIGKPCDSAHVLCQLFRLV